MALVLSYRVWSIKPKGKRLSMVVINAPESQNLSIELRRVFIEFRAKISDSIQNSIIPKFGSLKELSLLAFWNRCRDLHPRWAFNYVCLIVKYLNFWRSLVRYCSDDRKNWGGLYSSKNPNSPTKFSLGCWSFSRASDSGLKCEHWCRLTLVMTMIVHSLPKHRVSAMAN